MKNRDRGSVLSQQPRVVCFEPRQDAGAELDGDSDGVANLGFRNGIDGIIDGRMPLFLILCRTAMTVGFRSLRV